MTTGKILVFDIGGTSTRAALYSAGTDAIEHLTIRPTPSEWNSPQLSKAGIYQELLVLIRTMGLEVVQAEAIRGVSIAFPGPIDPQGRILAAPGILGESSRMLDLASDLKKVWPDLPIYLSNDMTAAGYRYLHSATDSFCLVTVSTGVGSKIFIDGIPQLGSSGAGGEIGHLKVLFDEDAPLCGCGKRGHLQAISSGHGTLEFVRNAANENPDLFKQSFLAQLAEGPDAISNQMVAKAYRAQDPFVTSNVHQCSRSLGATLATLHQALGLERFVIIGGFALALGCDYLNNLARQAEDCCWSAASPWDKMLVFGYEDDFSGLIGAGKLAMCRLASC